VHACLASVRDVECPVPLIRAGVAARSCAVPPTWLNADACMQKGKEGGLAVPAKSPLPVKSPNGQQPKRSPVPEHSVMHAGMLR
jgi:hypothetical protein